MQTDKNRNRKKTYRLGNRYRVIRVKGGGGEIEGDGRKREKQKERIREIDALTNKQKSKDGAFIDTRGKTLI